MKTNETNRRNFLKKAAAGGLLSLALPQLALSAFAAPKAKKISIRKDDVILFQGDSITDAGRARAEQSENHSKALGTGYAFLAAADLLNNHADKNLKIYNRGISGNKVYQLAERWDADALQLKPTILSILIGVNDYWHKHNKRYDGTIETYRTDYRKLLDRTLEQLPDVKLVIGEPFAIIGRSVDQTWFPQFNEYRYAAREIAQSYKAVFVPYQEVFDKALKTAPASHWAPDGVHPSVAGARLMANAWLEAVTGK